MTDHAASRRAGALRAPVFFVLLLVALAAGLPAQGKDMPKGVTDIDLQRFLGTWYEVARLPNSFENGLEQVTATYSLKPDGNLDVLNQGVKQGKPTQAHGTAWVQDKAVPGRLFVAFFLFFGSDYTIFDYDRAGYAWALVTSASRDFLWVLSRSPSLAPALYDDLLARCRAQGFDLSKLIKVPQKG